MKPPRRNLPPAADDWGRWVDTGLLDLSRDTAQANQSVSNSLQNINATLEAISGQIEQLSTPPSVSSWSVVETGPWDFVPPPPAPLNTRVVRAPEWATGATVQTVATAHAIGDPTIDLEVRYFVQCGTSPHFLSILTEAGIDGLNNRHTTGSSLGYLPLTENERDVYLIVEATRSGLITPHSAAFKTDSLIVWNR